MFSGRVPVSGCCWAIAVLGYTYADLPTCMCVYTGTLAYTAYHAIRTGNAIAPV